jgi:hypothetical protein
MSCKEVDDKPKDLIKSMEYDVLVELKLQPLQHHPVLFHHSRQYFELRELHEHALLCYS